VSRRILFRFGNWEAAEAFTYALAARLMLSSENLGVPTLLSLGTSYK
jgi:hypothetical protein